MFVLHHNITMIKWGVLFAFPYFPSVFSLLHVDLVIGWWNFYRSSINANFIHFNHKNFHAIKGIVSLS